VKHAPRKRSAYVQGFIYIARWSGFRFD